MIWMLGCFCCKCIQLKNLQLKAMQLELVTILIFASHILYLLTPLFKPFLAIFRTHLNSLPLAQNIIRSAPFPWCSLPRFWHKLFPSPCYFCHSWFQEDSGRSCEAKVSFLPRPPFHICISSPFLDILWWLVICYYLILLLLCMPPNWWTYSEKWQIPFWLEKNHQAFLSCFWSKPCMLSPPLS